MPHRVSTALCSKGLAACSRLCLALCKSLQCLVTLMRRSHAKRTRACVPVRKVLALNGSAARCPFTPGQQALLSRHGA